jgi:hypothetical protein
MQGIQHLWIPGTVPGLNEILAASSTVVRGPHGGFYREYQVLKRQWSERVVLMARAQDIKRPSERGCYLTYLFFEEAQRRDPSNFTAGGMKVIEDGLQAAGILQNDGWQDVLGFAAYWVVDKKNPGTAVFISNHSVLDKNTALAQDEQQRGR